MQELLNLVLGILGPLGEGLRSVAPVIGILLVFQLVVLRTPLENWGGSPSASRSPWWAW